MQELFPAVGLKMWEIAFVGMEIADFHVFSKGDLKAVSPLEIWGSWDHLQINC